MNKTLQSVLAVLAGFILVGFLGFVADTLLQSLGVLPQTGTVRFEDRQSLLALSYHLIFVLLGGYVTARLAPDRPIAHAIALGILGILFSILGLIAITTGDLAPAWYGWALILLSVPVTWAGGLLFVQFRKGENLKVKPMNAETKRGATRWLIRETFGNLFLIALLLGFAGRWDWAPGWALSAIYIIWSAAVIYFILPKNPEMLAERARPKAGTKKWDFVILGIFGVLGLAIYIVAGLDFRFGWSQSFSPAVQVAGFVFAFISYDLIVVWSMVANAFFVATVRIQSERNQTVAAGGPYRFVRHPGYVGTIIFQLATPFMLNSAWALIPAGAATILFIIRTALEDKTLQEELPGYKEYAAKVRYRLIPGVW